MPLTTLQAVLIVAALALGLILVWKLAKLAVKVAVLGAIIVVVYLVGAAAGWWPSVV